MAADQNSRNDRSARDGSKERIKLSHGSGGRLMHDLIRDVFVAAFGRPETDAVHDGYVMERTTGRAVFTTDAYVVDPLFFPGGDIGTLAVNGTVNDLAMCGARPLYLSVAFIIEEGFLIDDLIRIARSMAEAARKAKVRIVTGDTKVVDHGHGHGLFITTAGVGVREHDMNIHPASIRPGDKIILSGDIGRHGIAVLSVREGFQLNTKIESDCAPLADAVMKIIAGGAKINCLRDLTRGGLATSLVELAESSHTEFRINEGEIPVAEEVRGACEILGLDPLYIANEGRFVAFIPAEFSDNVKSLLPDSRVIGDVHDGSRGAVILKSLIGTDRYLNMLSGEQFPRIC